MPLSLAAAADDLQRLSWTLRRKPLESFLAPQAAVPQISGAGALVCRDGSLVDAVRPPELSEREKKVLERLGGLQDKQIAAELGLTEHGVRYHLRKLFAKLGANTRVDALLRARELDLLPGES